jgi:hypothetical protein
MSIAHGLLDAYRLSVIGVAGELVCSKSRHSADYRDGCPFRSSPPSAPSSRFVCKYYPHH